MNDNVGDSFTLEDIIKEFGGGRESAASDPPLPEGVTLGDIEQELRELLGMDGVPEAASQPPAQEDLPAAEEPPAEEEPASKERPPAREEPPAEARAPAREAPAPEKQAPAAEQPPAEQAPAAPEGPAPEQDLPAGETSTDQNEPALAEEPDGQLHWLGEPEEPEPEEPWSAKTDEGTWPPALIEEPEKKRKRSRPRKKQTAEPRQTVISDLYRDDYYALRAVEEDYSLHAPVKKEKTARRPKLPELPVQVRSAERTVQEVERGERGLFLRLRICLIVTAVNVLLAVYNGLGLHWIRGFENVAALSVISLLLLAVAAGAAYHVLAAGFAQIRKAEFGVEALTVLLCAVALPETVFAVREQRLSLCALSSVVILCVLWAVDCKAQALRRSALTMTETGLDAEDVGRADGVRDGAPAAVIIPDERRTLEAMLDAEDPQRKASALFVPAAVILTAMLAAAGAIVGKTGFFCLWTAMLAGAAPLGAILSFALPFRLTAHRLSRVRAVLGGWTGARMLAKCRAMFLDDPMLFPGQNLKLSGVKVFGEFDSVQVMQYCAAVLEQIGSHVVDRLAMFDDVLPPVQALRCYDEGGVGGEIGPDSVLVGTWKFLQKMGVHMEEGTRIRQALYVSVRGELAGLVALRYEAAPKVREALEKLSGPGTAQPVLTGADVLVTRSMLRSKFGLSLRNLAGPPLRERLELTRRAERSAVSCALLGKPSLEAYAAVLRSARALTGATGACLILGVLAAVSAVGALFFFALTGMMSGISCAKMLLFMCVWALLSALAMLPVLKK